MSVMAQNTLLLFMLNQSQQDEVISTSSALYYNMKTNACSQTSACHSTSTELSYSECDGSSFVKLFQ